MPTSISFYIDWSYPFLLRDKRFTSLENRRIGVYIIWNIIDNKINYIYVGKGAVGGRLKAHRDRPEIFKHNPVYATWAKTPYIMLDPISGIERYLIDTLRPVVNKNTPRANPIEVNLPCYLTL